MNKKFLNFGLFLALGLTTAVFNSCDKDDGGNGGSGGNASKITATNVINGSTQIKTVKALAWWESGDYDYGSDAIAQAPYQNNGFTLELPATVGSKYLETLEADEMLEAGISISNKNVKVFFLYDLRGYNADDDEIGDFYLEEENENSEHYTSWMYVDGDVTIKGEYKVIDEEYDEEYIEKYDLTLKKGWNVVYDSEVESYKNGRDVYSYTISSKKPSGVNYTWNFYGDSDYRSASVALKSAKNTKSTFSKFKGSKKK